MDIGDLTLYTGDTINLVASDGRYVQRYFEVLQANGRHRELTGNFSLQVLDERNVYLRADNGKYLEYYIGVPEEMTPIVLVTTDTPGKNCKFRVDVVGNNVIRLSLAGSDAFFYESHTGQIQFKSGTNDSSEQFAVSKSGTCTVEERVTDMQFRLDAMSRFNQLMVLHNQQIKNRTPLPQEHVISFEKSILTEKTFGWESGFSLAVSTTFTAGIPFCNDATTFSASTHFSAGGMSREAETTTFKETQKVVAPSNTTVTAEAQVFTAKIDVPYVARVERSILDGQSRRVVFAYDVSGTFRNVNSYDYRVKISTENACKP